MNVNGVVPICSLAIPLFTPCRILSWSWAWAFNSGLSLPLPVAVFFGVTGTPPSLTRAEGHVSLELAFPCKWLTSEGVHETRCVTG